MSDATRPQTRALDVVVKAARLVADSAQPDLPGYLVCTVPGRHIDALREALALVQPTPAELAEALRECATSGPTPGHGDGPGREPDASAPAKG